MLRLLLVCATLASALAAPVTAAQPAPTSPTIRVSAFFYPWYGTASANGTYQHWSQRGHVPPTDIAAAYYPALGVYSSSDRRVLAQQMQELRSAGVDEIAASWWGRGSPEDQRLPEVAAAAAAAGISAAVHLEPYGGRTVASTVGDVAYLESLGFRTFYVYRMEDLPLDGWAAAMPQLHSGGALLFAQTGLPGRAAKAGFDGAYTYDIVTYGAGELGRYCLEAHALHLLCAPSVGPGYDAARGSGDTKVKPRRDGATYDAMWRAAIAAHADRVTITSFNEWHEGTQIEPASVTPPRGHYLSYDGAWSQHGPNAAYAYIARTAYWSHVFRGSFAGTG